MKTISTILLFMITFSMTARKPPTNIVTLTAGQVSSARDIEVAIEKITQNGTLAGTVVLDARRGAFRYTGQDRSINIYYSYVTLLSKNGAVIDNCEDGIFLDNVHAGNLRLEGITFNCTANGVTGNGGVDLHNQVIIQNNTFNVGNEGIVIGSVNNWTIQKNRIFSQGTAVHLIGGLENLVSQNVLSGVIGVYLQGTNGNNVTRNNLHASWQGVLIGSGDQQNHVLNNRIIGPQSSGIALEGENSGNYILKNKVACAARAECLVIAAYPGAYQTNTIVKNSFFRPKR